MHGKEGKRADYTSYSCVKIIMGSGAPATGEYHGCPYRHYNEGSLNSLLTNMKLGVPERHSILSHVKNKNYQVACIKHFEVTHPGSEELIPEDAGKVGNHPNGWMEASVKYHKAKAGGGAAAAAAAAKKPAFVHASPSDPAAPPAGSGMHTPGSGRSATEPPPSAKAAAAAASVVSPPAGAFDEFGDDFDDAAMMELDSLVRTHSASKA